MVGDTTFDIPMAHRAGAHGIGVCWGYHRHDKLLKAGANVIVHGFHGPARSSRRVHAMRDDLCALFVADEERDPVKSAQRDLKRPLPKKFYKDVSVRRWTRALGSRWTAGRSAPRRAPLAVPNKALAEALAAEWRGQGEHINPATMPKTRMVNTALDGVAREMERWRRKLPNSPAPISSATAPARRKPGRGAECRVEPGARFFSRTFWARFIWPKA